MAYQRHQVMEEFYEAVTNIGWAEAIRNYPDHATSPHIRNAYKRPGVLFSSIYRILNRPIRTLVLDEVQFAKNHLSVTHAALKALFYDRVLMLTGTPFANRWYDIWGLLNLFPTSHFCSSFETFMRTFAAIDKSTMLHSVFPAPRELKLLSKFLQSCTVARTNEVLVPSMSIEYYNFELDDKSALVVMFYAEGYQRALWALRSDKSSQGHMHNRAMSNAANAQLAAAHMLLYNDHMYSNVDGMIVKGRRFRRKLGD